MNEIAIIHKRKTSFPLLLYNRDVLESDVFFVWYGVDL